jgi:hypothetical protein
LFSCLPVATVLAQDVEVGSVTPRYPLTSEEQQQIDGILAKWKESIRKTPNISANVNVWVTDGVWGRTTEYSGSVGFVGLEKWLFRTHWEKVLDADRQTQWKLIPGELWALDGKRLTLLNYEQKSYDRYDFSEPPRSDPLNPVCTILCLLRQPNELREKFVIRLATSAQQSGNSDIYLTAEARDPQPLPGFFGFQLPQYNRVEFILSSSTDFGLLPRGIRVTSPETRHSVTWAITSTKSLNEHAWSTQCHDFEPRMLEGWRGNYSSEEELTTALDKVERLLWQRLK